MIPLTTDIEFLQKERDLRAMSPGELTLGRGWDEAAQLQEDLRAVVTTERHRAQPSNEFVHVHRSKTNDSILSVLQTEQLIKAAESTPYKGEVWEWMLVGNKRTFGNVGG